MVPKIKNDEKADSTFDAKKNSAQNYYWDKINLIFKNEDFSN